ncbi:unnamed protein product [Mesocestoides corti]|uniref:Uncharacterized protein n=1 Tax=Mesocestoides corti TaxID=53468 RepID=A0A0R3UHS3_MESCO|nr:unnamed protein product [Mesocestoides corti]
MQIPRTAEHAHARAQDPNLHSHAHGAARRRRGRGRLPPKDGADSTPRSRVTPFSSHPPPTTATAPVLNFADERQRPEPP